MNERERESRAIHFFTKKKETPKPESEAFYAVAFIACFVMIIAMIVL